MPRCVRPFFAVPLLVVSLLATPSRAFDCTPIGTLPNNGTLSMGTIGGAGSVPGESLCGTDYTGWAFHVYEFTVNDASLQVFGLVASDGDPFNGVDPYAELWVLDQCNPTACLFEFSTGGGATSDPFCLAPGTYTIVVASPDLAPNNIYGVGTATADVCQPVSGAQQNWGTLKQRY